MKKTLTTIFLILMILTVVGVALVPQQANAANILEGATTSFVNNLLAGIANAILGLTSTLVTVSGTFLSISINLTTHIGNFFNSMPALRDVWVVVRNISSIFIIFMLLFSSIMTILGSGSSNIKTLVGKIIMAGLLINFSLFFVRVAIDASNIVSLQFYRAIAPETSGNFTTTAAYFDGGLSDVFMSSLKIPQIYQNKGVLKSTDIGLSIFFATVAGIIMMIVASFSFLAAAIAFTIRTGLLLFIMAISPIFFAGMIFPQIKKGISDKMLGLLQGQLIFMPAYLFLMYVALKVISSDGYKAIFNQSATGIAPAGEVTFGPTFIGVIIQFVIALLFINAPLLFAIQSGAWGAKWAPTLTGVSKWAGNVAKGAGRKTWENTGGRIASRVARSESFQNLAGNTRIGELALKGTRSVAKNYDKKLTEKTTERINFAGTLNREAARNYAARISQTIPARISIMGTIGRADRVAAAKILRTRRQEIETDLNKLNSEFDRLTAIHNPASPNHRPFNSNEQARWDMYNNTNRKINEIYRAEDELGQIDRQITDFEARTGSSARIVEKRNY